MMHKKAQGAMEYLMTYGWAIIVVIVVGIILWQLGLFKPQAVPIPGIGGFGELKPMEYLCDVGVGATDTVTIMAVNGAGGEIRNVTIHVGASSADCSPANVPTGGDTICSISNVDCGTDTLSTEYKVDVSMHYISPGGMPKKSSGTIWGPGE